MVAANNKLIVQLHWKDLGKKMEQIIHDLGETAKQLYKNENEKYEVLICSVSFLFNTNTLILLT